MQFIYQTKRLSIRVVLPEDAGMIQNFYYENRDFLEPFEPKRPENFYTTQFHHSNLMSEYNGFLKMNYFRYWLFLQEELSTPIGSVCFSNVLHGAFQSCMVGYKLGKNFCHYGYMQEALSFLIPVVMSNLHLHRMEAYVQPSNQPSICLLNKLGFVEEGYIQKYAKIQDIWTDHLLFSYLDTSIIQ